MKISYNWLKEYLDFKDDHLAIGEKLTSLGLEVEGITKYESIPGGLKGVVSCALCPSLFQGRVVQQLYLLASLLSGRLCPDG